MEKWVFEHSAESDAPPESIWERYTDVELWREWSKGVEESKLEGEVEPSNGGSRITHRAKIDGPLDFLWGPAIGWMVKRELAPSVDRLAELAVEKEEQIRKEEEEKEKRRQRLHKADE